MALPLTSESESVTGGSAGPVAGISTSLRSKAASRNTTWRSPSSSTTIRLMCSVSVPCGNANAPGSQPMVAKAPPGTSVTARADAEMAPATRRVRGRFNAGLLGRLTGQ